MSPELPSEVADVLSRAAEVVRRRIGAGDRVERLGLRLGLVHAPTGLSYQRYAPSLSMVLDGRKRSVIGEDDQVWGMEHFLITPVELPVAAGVVQTGSRGDFVSAVWKLDPVVVAEVASRAHRRPVDGVGPERLGSWTPALADAVGRLVGLLDGPEDIEVLAPLVSREVTLRLLQTDQAERLLAAVAAPDSRTVVRAVELLNAELDRAWPLDALAAEVGASPSTLVKRFRQVTGMSPGQYHKRLRLGEAQRRMVLLGESAAQAASVVGYVSASHFSRDYRAAYSTPPAADAARLRRRLQGELDHLAAV